MYQLLHGDNLAVLRSMSPCAFEYGITSPPYNLGANEWDMGGDGSKRRHGIEYANHDDSMNQADYEAWQIELLDELYSVASPGASFFYNHKTRTLNGELIHPMRWLRNTRWAIRQEIIWDRVSTHNHEPRLFWPVDERIYWLTKGKPNLAGVNVGLPSVWREFGPVANTWHPAPFTIALPRMLLKAVNAQPGATIIDPFAGSCTTIKAALEIGCNAIGIDKCGEYLDRARVEIEDWLRAIKRQPRKLFGKSSDYDSTPLFQEASCQ
jgi:site-specific DNA-methyltransferase (adenine-specific)